MKNDPLKPAIITVFGVTGDLAKRKLLPALYHLAHDGLLPPTTKIVGVNRRGISVDDIITMIQDSVEKDRKLVCEPETLKWLKQAISVVKMDITVHEEYVRLKSKLDAIEDEVGLCLTRIFYLAIPSTLFAQVAERLGKQDLNKGCQHGDADSRLLIEKPFGYDQASAKELINQLQEAFTEKQIYRIDHYLAKETTQNILTFRFQNPLFANAWDKNHVSHIVVTAAESIGIEGRVSFYEQMGALRDLIQSHLLQLVALTTMDEPETMSSDHIHEKKKDILQSIKPPHLDKMASDTVRAQYKTYKNEVNNHDSSTETFAAIKLRIENDRWDGVPVLIRTGKALAAKVTEITVVYNSPDKPECINTLTIRIQPDEGIVLDLRIKKPGFDDGIEHVQMDFCYRDSFTASHPDAYERVLVDALRGDKTLFATSDEILESWRITEPILQAWQANQTKLESYDNGSWGPDSSDSLASSANAEWLTDALHICKVHPQTKIIMKGITSNE